MAGKGPDFLIRADFGSQKERGQTRSDGEYERAELLLNTLNDLRRALQEKRSDLRRTFYELENLRNELGILESGQTGSIFIGGLKKRIWHLEKSQVAMLKRIGNLQSERKVLQEKNSVLARTIEDLEVSAGAQVAEIVDLKQSEQVLNAEVIELKARIFQLLDNPGPDVETLSDDLQLFLWACQSLGLDFYFFFQYDEKKRDWYPILSARQAVAFVEGVLSGRLAVCETEEAESNVREAIKDMKELIQNHFK